jgi:hypothetical protein
LNDYVALNQVVKLSPNIIREPHADVVAVDDQLVNVKPQFTEVVWSHCTEVQAGKWKQTGAGKWIQTV